jgi:NAD(P)H dehydrogenase (quinone)
MRILVTGASGQLGSAVIETLLKKMPARQITALTRDEAKIAGAKAKGVQVALGNYDDVGSLQTAMRGIDTVLLVSASDQGDRMQQHKNVVDAAKSAGVPGIAYTSRALRHRDALANPLMLEHFQTEDYIRASGLAYTIFRNALYMDVLPLFVGKQVFETGIFQPAGDGKVAFALRTELGEAIANVLSAETCENKIYTFTGSAAYSFYDVAAVLSRLSGKEVKYTAVDVPAFEKRMKERGLPEMMVRKIVDFNTDIKNGQEAGITADLENTLGRRPATLADGLGVLFKL